MSIELLFLESVIKRFKEYKTLGEKTFDQLTTAQLHHQPHKASNSIAIIIQHLHGNMRSRWTAFLTEDGEKAWRRRDAEFEIKAAEKEVLLQLWHQGWEALFSTLTTLTAEDLAKTITIRSQPLTVVDAINRQLAHYSYHVGQIVFLGKWMIGNGWQSLTIPKGGSQAYNTALQKP